MPDTPHPHHFERQHERLDALLHAHVPEGARRAARVEPTTHPG